MPGVRIVNAQQVVEDIDDLLIAFNGQAREVAAGYVANNGQVCQFWPSTLEPADIIVLDTDRDESYDSSDITSPPPKAICYYNQQTARLELSLPDGTIKEIQVLNPPPRGTGYYLIRFEPVSGTFEGNDPENAWLDVFQKGTLGVFEWWLPNNTGTPGRVLGEANFSVAENNGSGSPVAGTVVTKPIDFIAEIVGSNFSFTPTPWDIEDVRVNEPAGVIILTVPSGFGEDNEAFVTGNKGVAGSSVEVIREIYANDWNSSYQVRVDVVSGSIQGDDTGVLLSTNTPRQWYIRADNDGDDVNTVIDLTIDNGQRAVTKRITMRAARTDEVSDSLLDPEFTRYDMLEDTWRPFGGYTPPPIAQVTMRVTRQGEVEAELRNDGPLTTFPQNWNQSAPSVPDPENYECRLTLTDNRIDGENLLTGSAPLDTWLNLSSTRQWIWQKDGTFSPELFVEELDAEYNLEIREVGRPETVLTKVFDVHVYVVAPGDDDNGGPIP